MLKTIKIQFYSDSVTASEATPGNIKKTINIAKHEVGNSYRRQSSSTR